MKYKNSYTLLVVVFIIGIFAGYDFFLVWEMKRDGLITNGKIRAVSYGGRTSATFEYEFIYDNQRRTSNTNAGVNSPENFVGKSFPVIVSTFTKKSSILVTPSHFEKYDLPFPDSLKWVLDYLK